MNKIILQKNHLRLLLLSLMLSLSMTTLVFAGGGSSTIYYTEGDFTIIATTGEVTGYTGTATHLTIPSEVAGITVTKIGADLFKEHPTLASVSMPNTVTSIGSNAFFNCAKLTSVTLSTSLKEIESAAFALCYSLSSITLPSGITTLGLYAFWNCSSLAYINIPDTVTTLGPYFVSGCSSLESITIPKSVTTVKDAFTLDHTLILGNVVFNYFGFFSSPPLYVYSGSAAEAEAKAQNYAYALLDADGNVTPDDTTTPDNNTSPEYTYHKLTALYSDRGYVTANTSTPYAGELVTFLVHPSDYFWISSISVRTASGQVVAFDFDSYQNQYTFTQPAEDVIITVEYGFSGFDVTTSTPSNGSLSVTTNSTQAGDRVVIKATPNSGYRVGSVTATTSFGYSIPVGYDSVRNEYAFIQPYSAVNVSATFTNTSSTTYIPFVVPNSNGSAWLSTTNPTAGDVVQITLNPADGHSALKVSVTSSTGGIIPCTKISDTTYQFIQPDSRAVIEVFYYYTTHVTQYFDDITATNTYAPYVAYVVDRGWMTGTSSSTFEPNMTITRGMAAVIFAHLSQETIPTATSTSFWDCYTGQWYSNAVEWCKSRNIVSGYENGSFGLNDPITKEQLATMMYGFSKHYGLETYAYYPEFICSFADADDTSSYAFIPMTWSLSYSYLRGSSTNILSPQAQINRGEMARMLSQFFEGTTHYRSIAVNGWSPVVVPEFVNISLSR